MPIVLVDRGLKVHVLYITADRAKTVSLLFEVNVPPLHRLVRKEGVDLPNQPPTHVDGPP